MRRSACFAALAILATTTPAALIATKSGPKTLAFVEVNHNNLTNVGRYALKDGLPAFDVATIFAANIRKDGKGAAYLQKNKHVQAVLRDVEHNVRPLQKKGIKVPLSILGGGEGVGLANFQSQSAATAFAKGVANDVRKHGLDGVDLDDEYAEYGQHGGPPLRPKSMGWFISALRSELGTGKLISFYAIGHAYNQLQKFRPSIDRKVSFSLNPYYGSYRAPTMPGLGKKQLAAAAIDFTRTPQDDAASFAERTVLDGYGYYITYNLRGGDHSAYLSAITEVLYGSAVTYK